MSELIYELPYPPSVNHIYSRTKKGGLMLTPNAREYRDEVIAMIGKGHTTLKGPLKMRIALYMPDKRKRDIDNPLKATFDALTHANVYDDDSQIEKLYVEKIGVESPGRVVITISQIEV